MNFDILFEIVKKELRLFFVSPIGYLFLAAFLGLTLFVFFWGESFFARNISDVRPMFEWLPVLLIFLCSALTMRVWSDERRTGTIEFLVTLPATTFDLVAGKFLACFVLLVIALLLTFPLPVSVWVIAAGDLDWGPVWAGYIAALLLGGAYLSVGLFVSSRSENQIVALILAVFVCGVFYLIGSDFLTSFVNNDTAALLRELGSGSRFESILRGVVDFSDLYFYVSITTAFLTLNMFVLGTLGWAHDADRQKHISSALVSGLIVVNLLLANVWVGQLPSLRLDVTEGGQYTIAAVTKQQLRQVQEPLLIRGYFSAKTHPLLAPLVPQLRDLLEEYAIIGGSRVQVEFLDPVLDPEKEEEANSKYGIRPAAFQVEDRYQSSLVNSYFDILVRYGDEYEVLSFSDLIEVKAESEMEISVQLRNPEYDLTRAIKKVLSRFQSGGSMFDYVADSVRFTGYISAADRLPPSLEVLRAPLESVLEELKGESSGKFDWEIVEPEAGDGRVADEILENFGFRPMAASLFDSNTFYFYLTLTDGSIVLSMEIPDTQDADGFRRTIDEGLKRFATGLLTSVAIYTAPTPAQQYPGQPAPGAYFNEFLGYMIRDYDVEVVDLRDPIPRHSDILIVVAPTALDDEQVFEIDQFLMRGGTVIIATGAFEAIQMERTLYAAPKDSGLNEWLQHHGVSVGSSMVLDVRNSSLPFPQVRTSGEFSFYEIAMIDYPFFIDIRNEGFVDRSPIVQDLAQLTYAWGSPITVAEEINQSRKVSEIFRSSDQSWLESFPDIAPRATESGESAYVPGSEQASHLLAVNIEGQFTSFFEESPYLVAARERAEREAAEAAASDETEESSDEASSESEDGPMSDEEALRDLEEYAAQIEAEEAEEPVDTLGVVGTVIDKSPESARLVVIGSSDLVSDQTIQLLSSASGTLYANSYRFIANLVDVSMEDSSLLSIRSRGHFNRLLPKMSDQTKQFLEIGNYIFALLGLGIVFGVNYFLRQRRAATQAQWFGGSK